MARCLEVSKSIGMGNILEKAGNTGLPNTIYDFRYQQEDIKITGRKKKAIALGLATFLLLTKIYEKNNNIAGINI